MSSVDPLSVFPKPILTPILNDGNLPNYSNLTLLQQELNSNAISVTSPICQLGHLVLTVSPAEYATRTLIPLDGAGGIFSRRDSEDEMS